MSSTLTRSFGLFFLALIVAEMSGAYSSATVYTVLPALVRIHGNPINVGWVITALLLMQAVSAAICGRIGDLVGRRRILCWALAVYGLGGLCSALAPNLALVILGSALQGVAGATLPLTYGLARQHLSPDKVPIGIGFVTAAAFLGSFCGFILGGLIVDRVSWNAVFFTAPMLAGTGIVLLLRYVPAMQRAAHPVAYSVDRAGIVGGILFAPAIAFLLLAASKSREWGWHNPLAWGSLLLGLTLLVVWILHQSRQSNPLIDVRLFRFRIIVLGNLCMGLTALGHMQFTEIFSLFLRQPAWTGAGFGLSGSAAGGFLMASAAIGLVFAPASGWMISRHGGRVMLLTGTAITSGGWLMLSLHQQTLWWVLAALFAAGCGMAIIYTTIPNLIVAQAPPDRTSEATGLTSVIRATLLAIGSQIVFHILATATINNPENPTGKFFTDQAFTMVFLYVFLTCALSFAAAWLLPRRA